MSCPIAAGEEDDGEEGKRMLRLCKLFGVYSRMTGANIPQQIVGQYDKTRAHLFDIVGVLVAVRSVAMKHVDLGS